MFTCDFKAAFRNIFRNRITSLISILGLGIGLGCIIILLALIVHEKSFDRFIPDYRNVYRVTFGNLGQTSYPLAETMSAEFPEVKDYFRYYQAMSVQIRTKDNEILRESNFGFADSSVYRILGIRMISGVPATGTGQVAISKDAALKFFGNLTPLGLVLPVKFGDGFTPLTVSGVFDDLPSNSTLFPSFIADIRLSEKMFSQWQRSLGDFGADSIGSFGWKYQEFLTYLVLHRNSDPAAVASKMEKYKEHLAIENKSELHFRLQPVAEIYLRSDGISVSQLLRQGNQGELIYYEVISLMILIISLANYILLTRAGVAERVLNLGTRKAFGASHGKIRRLIILESNMVVLISLVPAIFIIEYGIKIINTSLNKTLTAEVFVNPVLLIILLCLVVLTGTIAGWLIGLYYSKIPALDLISGKTRSSGKSGRWNYSFLIVHFTIYMIFAAGIIGVSKQIRFSKSGYKGIDPRNIIISDLSSASLMAGYNTIKNEMERVPGVIGVAGGSFVPPFGNQLPITLATAEGEKIRFDGLIMGEGMTELLGIEMIEGLSFGPYKGGPPEVLINESTAKAQKVRAGEKLLVFNVRGIVKDFNVHSMHLEIQPLVILQQNPERMNLVAVKTDGKNDEVVKERMNQLFRQIAPDEIFEARFLTDRIENFYRSESNQARIIGSFAILAAVLSIMGLFGISIISINKRRKEIGLRKVNGAATREVLLMVNLDFLKWVLVAFVIAVPVSIYLLDKWLERFAYKAGLSWWIFALAGLSAVIIAILTVSLQSLRAARSNPVEALRHE